MACLDHDISNKTSISSLKCSHSCEFPEKDNNRGGRFKETLTYQKEKSCLYKRIRLNVLE
jgi:hypothetical protein